MNEAANKVHFTRCLWLHISPRRRKQFALLLVLMLCASFAEIISIGAVLPFLGALTSPDHVFQHPLSQPFIEVLGLTGPGQILLPLSLAFGVAVLLAGGMRLLLLWVTTRLSFAIGADLSFSIYSRTLYQPYSVHVARNSSEVIAGISSKTHNVTYNIIVPVLTLISSGIMLVAILLALLSVNPFIALVSFGGFGLIYVGIIGLTRRRLLSNGERIAIESNNVIKSLQEGLGGIRDVLLDGNQAIYCRVYRNADLPLRSAQGANIFISQSPRYGMEALGMLLIALLAYVLAQQADGLVKAIPVLGAMALGAQRLLPVLQQLYAAWSAIQGGKASLYDTLDLLEQPLPDYAHQLLVEPLRFEKEISLNQVSFRHGPDSPWVFRDIDLNIPKGSRVGFVGVTGSGKSTLLDIVMALLMPTAGSFEVDGEPIGVNNHRAWQVHIAHVPQAIFLADCSIEENIAFGVSAENIDHERVREAALRAQIAEAIESWPDQYQTRVGERGIRLSGGQRQRIGIARALYKQADVIVFDEATSALDNETELAVMQAIEDLSGDLTILIIAHRLTTLKKCTRVIELGNGGIVKSGTYLEMVNQQA